MPLAEKIHKLEDEASSHAAMHQEIESKLFRLDTLVNCLCINVLGWRDDEEHKIFSAARSSVRDRAIGAREKIKRSNRVIEAKQAIAEELGKSQIIEDQFKETIASALVNFAENADWKKPEAAAQELIEALFKE